MKKSRFFMTAIAVLCMAQATVFAQENEVEADLSGTLTQEVPISKETVNKEKALKYENAIGFSFLAGNPQATSPYAYGFDYQRWCTDRIGFQLCAGGFWNPSSKECLSYSFSAQIQAKLFSFSFEDVFTSLLYFWGMAGHNGYQTQTSSWNEEAKAYDFSPDPFIASLTLGIGLGVDFILVEHISIPVTFGCVGEFINNNYLGLAGGIGIRFRF